MGFHRKSVQDCRENWIVGKPKTAGEEVAKTTTSPSSGVGVCSSKGARPVPEGKNPAASYSLIMLVVTLDSPKTLDRAAQGCHVLFCNELDQIVN
jgi:hypothetical protein